MSLVIENAAFYDPEPEVENFQVAFLSESRSANIFLGLENFLRSVRGVIKRAFSITRDINSYYLLVEVFSCETAGKMAY